MSEVVDSGGSAKREKIIETQNSTSTSESGLIEDVEIINASDEDEISNESVDDRTKEETIEDEEELEEKEDDKSVGKSAYLSVAAEEANYIADLTEEQKDEIFNEEQQQSAIRNLIVCSFLLFTIPIAITYSSYKFLFKEKYHMSDADAALYGGILGVFSVYVIVCGFVYVAYREETDLEKKYKEVKSQ